MEKKVEVIKYDSYIDKIKKDAESFSSQKETIDLLLSIKSSLENKKLSSELTQLYEINLDFEQFLSDLPRKYEIGKWIEDNKNNFFAEPKYIQTSYEEEIKPSPIEGIAGLLRGNKIITKYKSSLDGYELTVELPYKSILIDYVPKFPNLSQYATLISFLVSKKDIKFFYAFTDYSEKGWDKKMIKDNFKWQSIDYLIKDIKPIYDFIDKIFSDATLNITNILKKKFEINENVLPK